MFSRLRQKWKVNTLQLILVLSTFAIGGSLTGYVARRLMPLLGIGPYWLWLLVFILMMTLIWPLAVLLVSIPLGQYSFFIKYIRKIGRRVGIGSKPPTGDRAIRLAIFASGAGSNAQKIIDHFRDNQGVKIALIITNNKQAGIVKIAEKEQIPVIFLEKKAFFSEKSIKNELSEFHISWLILAGFLWKIPSSLIKEYPGKIINIHPALLPKYGGKGMYGNRVHEAVLLNKETESGISIHFVDELYDHGPIIFQAKCQIVNGDTAESLAQRIHKLEHQHYPATIEKIILGIS